ncbi:hypothetical protein [Jutongia hominis]|uniref:Uncharacterized protein n=1 Tax=Jutongia hominis TaxID=2763664 RepID=A0ABR7MUN4_9FIRM|nr:hypothetical protein [Jutongia hominis]MBC8557195.1 hypothetical protein [Jutongia hominis]
MTITPKQEVIFLAVILTINTMIAAGYLIYGLAFRVKKEKDEKDPVRYVILSLFMLLCPVIGPAFLGFGNLFYHLFFDTSIDLAAITFSKKRVDVVERPDESDEINLIPMEEAIMINDKENLRNLLLTVLRGDVKKSINAVTKALNSSDSEASHYAASAIMDIMNEFQKTLQKFYAQMDADPDDTEVMVLYINYLCEMLGAGFLSELEEKTYIYSLQKVCERLFHADPTQLKPMHYTALISLLTKINDLQSSELWIQRFTTNYPDHIEMYRCALHHYFSVKDKIHFFEYMNRLKHSNIPIDNDMLELIRTFS